MQRARPLMLVIIGLLFIPLGLMAAPSVVEARGPSTSATIAFQPAGSVVAGTQYEVTASGFTPNTWVTIGATYDTTYWYSGVADGSGTVHLTLDARAAGTIKHEAYEQRRNGVRLKATAYLTVVNP